MTVHELASTMAGDARQVALLSSITDSIDHVLASIRSYLDMDVAFLAEFTGEDRILRNVSADGPAPILQAGDVLPLARGYCQKVVDGRLPELIPDTSAVPATRLIPETQMLPIGAHISVPVRLKSGRIFGTFCCFSHLPNPALDGRDLQLMKTFAQLIATQIDATAVEDHTGEAKLARITAAIESGDPTMVYQPIYRLKDRQLIGVEALSRFRSEPPRTPDLWFREAEEVGLGEALELIAVRAALAEAVALPDHLSVNLNVSPSTLVRGGLLAAIGSFPPSRLVLEITEHTHITDYDAVLAELAPLRARGVRVAVDDAGAGYASLHHVLSLSPDFIKLDVSLTRDVDADPMRRAMAAALVAFARHTSGRIVAEGIETESEYATLLQLGVEKGQGFMLGRPMRMNELLGRLARAA